MVSKILFITLALFSNVLMAGTDIQNGGGGISVNGEVATFFSAEMKVMPVPLQTNDDFTRVELQLGQLPIPSRVKLELIQNILPSYTRRYYSVVKENVDEELLNRIKLEYNRVTKIPLENLTIFALTDPETKITLLLPDYFKLNSEERQAIIVHESLWVNKRVASYDQMVKNDRASQIYFMYPEDCVSLNEIILQLETVFKERMWALNASLSCEMKYYSRYSTDKSVPFLDVMDYKSLLIFSDLLINSSDYVQYYEVQKKFATSLDNYDARIFNLTKSNLVRELNKGIKIRTDFTNNARTLLDHHRGDNDSAVEWLSQNLLMNNFRLVQNPNYNIIKLISSPDIGEISLSTIDERTTLKK